MGVQELRMVASLDDQGSAIRHVQGDGSVVIIGADVRFRMESLKPGIVLLTVSGGRGQRGEDVRAEKAMLDEFEAEIKRSGVLTVFADMRESSKMSAQSREVAVEWMRRNKPFIKASHVLVRSRLVEMAMAIVAMVVGNGVLRMYSQTEGFCAAIRGVVPSFHDLPAIHNPSGKQLKGAVHRPDDDGED